jgi:hypothetical protein
MREGGLVKMIMDLLLKESTHNLMLQKELESKLEKLPKGCIKERKIRNNTYYYLAYRDNGKVINKYIGKSRHEAEKLYRILEKRKVYKNQLRQLKKDWKIYNKAGIVESTSHLSQVIDESARARDFSLSLRGFLDVFYSCKDNKRKMSALIKMEPVLYEKVPCFQYAICAATAHKLANDFGLKAPSWVWKQEYYMKEMYFGNINKGSLRIYNMLYAPPEFKHRGLFLDENILFRV